MGYKLVEGYRVEHGSCHAVSQEALAAVTKERDELQIQLDAWQSQFQTSQLSHARERLRAAEDSVGRLTATLATLTARLEEMRTALTRYGRHLESCHIKQRHDDRSTCLSDMSHECTCGIVAALRPLDAPG